MQKDLQPTTAYPSEPESSPETQRRRCYQDQDPLTEKIDPSGYVPPFEQFNEVNSRHPHQIFGFLGSIMASVGISSAFGIMDG